MEAKEFVAEARKTKDGYELWRWPCTVCRLGMRLVCKHAHIRVCDIIADAADAAGVPED